jgi:hypothetical protein
MRRRTIVGMKRGITIGIGVGVFLTLAGGATFWLLRQVGPEPVELRSLRATHDSLRRQLETHLAAEPLLNHAELDAGDVTVGIRTPYLGGLIREIAHRYLDRVQLDLAPDLRVRETGQLKQKLFVGTMTLGQWDVDLHIARLSGVLAAQAPDLSVATENKVRVSMPVRLVSAQGQGRLRFSWDSWNVANLVCKDFEVEEPLQATALPDLYQVRGAFALYEERGFVVARPEFPAEKYRVRMDLTPDSWSRVEAAVRAQDTFEKCGLAIDPEMVMPKLHELANAGFELKLPRSIFRSVEMPAQFRSQVEVQGTELDVSVEPRGLHLNADYFWYAAALRARILGTPPTKAPAPLPRPGRRDS